MQGQDFLPYIITVSVMIVVVMAAGIALYLLRGRLFGDRRGTAEQAGGMLETMRRMRDRGEISEDEYRTAQAALVAKAAQPKAEKQPSRADQPEPGPTLPTQPQRRADPSPELRAQPGFDLTGAPLPPPVRDDTDEHPQTRPD